MFFRNARIFCSDHQFHTGAFEIDGSVFGKVLPDSVPADSIDLKGAVVIPGLIDIHIHGNSGFDFSDGDCGALKSMARCCALQGVTSFVPTSMTLPYPALRKAFGAAAALRHQSPEGHARVAGIHMEGPYFSNHKKGAQNPAYLLNPDFDTFQALYDSCGGLIRIVDIAPELPGAAEFALQASGLCTVSAAHTDADYEAANAFFHSGGTHLTHLYNAMPGIHHRQPGIIPAAVENKNVRAEIICDGHHVHPAAVRLAFAMFGAERMILVSDSGRCAGLPEGSRFTLGNQDAVVRDGVGRLPDGTIACSAASLRQCLANAIAWGIPEEDAVCAATYNPACAIGAEKEIGTIAEGFAADFLVCSPDYSQMQTFIGGKKL